MENGFSHGEELHHLWQALRSDILRSGADEHTAEDVVQETWLRALRRRPAEQGRFYGWLHVVALRRLREIRRSDRHRAHREQAVARNDRVSHRTESDESLLLRYVAELPEPYRSVIGLRFVEDRDVGEIATLLGRSPETVRSQLKRGLQRLRARLGQDDERLGGYAWLAFLTRWKRARKNRLDHRWTIAGVGAAALLAMWTLWELPVARARVLDAPPVAVGRSDRDVALTEAPEVARRALELAPGASPQAPADRSRFAGVVRDPDGTPVPGARVLVLEASSEELRASTTTDERGRYEIEAGRHDILWATHGAWCPSRRSYPAFADAAAFDLFLAPARVRARVEVRDCEGRPVEAAEVVDTASDTSQFVAPSGALEFSAPPATGTTGADGAVELGLPRSGRVELVVLAPGRPAWSGEFQLLASEETLAIRLPEPVSLRGTCSDEAGRPASGARITVRQVGGRESREVRAGLDGTFVVEGLAPGPCVVRAAEEATLGVASARWEGRLDPGGRNELDLFLSPDATIHGVALDYGVPLVGALVALGPSIPHEAEGAQPRFTRTDGEGRFLFAGCSASAGYVLKTTPPGRSHASVLGPVLPSAKGLVLRLRLPESVRAPIEVEFTGPPSCIPRWVEIVRDIPATSSMLELASDSGRATTPPFTAGEFEVVAWLPGLGTWTESIRHDPAVPKVHRFDVPEPELVEVELELPHGVREDAVKVLVQVPGFNRFGLGEFGKKPAWRLLAWSAERRSFGTTLVPGSHVLAIGGDGLAKGTESITVVRGGPNRFRRAALAGLEVQLVFQPSRPLQQNEILQLELIAAEGSTSFRPAINGLRTDAAFEFSAWLPLGTAELRATTLQPPKGGQIIPYRALEGRRAIASGELVPGEKPPRLEIPLTEAHR